MNERIDRETNQEGKRIEKDLNERFLKTESSQTELGDYIDTGVLVYVYDGLAETSRGTQSSLFIIDKETVAATFLRVDFVKGLDSPIYSQNFNYDFPPEWNVPPKGSPIAGVIYKALQNQKDMTIFCLTVRDGASSARHRQCGTYVEHIKQGQKDFTNEVNEAWKNRKSINTCKLIDYDNFEDYYKDSITSVIIACRLGGDKKSFDLAKKVVKAQLDNKTYNNWNEFIIRVEPSSYTSVVEAIFYLYSVKKSGYLAPQDKLKKYNIHLAQAQYFQQELYDTQKIFKPIIGINMDKMYNGNAPFHYLAEDQIVNFTN
ncbi:hypothetical protein ABSA28_00732 [Candidatus Hepatincolaceae symbiont of Richtersius coronifer]